MGKALHLTSSTSILLLALGFAVKHFIFDFLWQTKDEVENKGKYGNPKGALHSLKHALGTLLVLFYFTPLYYLLAILDGLIHYHIDWVKMNYGEQDHAKSQFWRDLGLDQLAHTLTYIALTAVAINFKY